MHINYLPLQFVYKYLVYVCSAIFIFSCNKQDLKCSGNCVTLNISGRVYDATTDAGFNKTLVTIQWYDARSFLSAIQEIEQVKTDRNGYFDFNVKIDQSRFAREDLQVRVSSKPGYYSLPATYDNDVIYQVGSYDPSSLQSLKYRFYPETNLFIKLHRAQNDSFVRFDVSNSFISYLTTNQYSIMGYQNAKDTTIKTTVASNQYINIHWLKAFGFVRPVQTFSDSIFCRKGEDNLYVINY